MTSKCFIVNIRSRKISKQLAFARYFDPAQYDKQMQLAKRSAPTCHFERSVSEVEKSNNISLCNHEILRLRFRTDTVVALNITPWVASITTQPLPCHFERSVSEVEKSENVSIC